MFFLFFRTKAMTVTVLFLFACRIKLRVASLETLQGLWRRSLSLLCFLIHWWTMMKLCPLPPGLCEREQLPMHSSRWELKEPHAQHPFAAVVLFGRAATCWDFRYGRKTHIWRCLEASFFADRQHYKSPTHVSQKWLLRNWLYRFTFSHQLKNHIHLVLKSALRREVRMGRKSVGARMPSLDQPHCKAKNHQTTLITTRNVFESHTFYNYIYIYTVQLMSYSMFIDFL